MIKNILEISKLIGLVFVALLSASCDETIEKNTENSVAQTEIAKVYTPESLGLEIINTEELLFDPNLNQRELFEKQLLDFYESYIHLFPADSLTSDIIFRAGNICINLKDYDKALSFYNKLNKNYRSYQKNPESLYLQGFIYDTYKNEYGNAKAKFEQLIKLYPNHALAEQARRSIENLGLSDEEIIRDFEKNAN